MNIKLELGKLLICSTISILSLLLILDNEEIHYFNTKFNLFVELHPMLIYLRPFINPLRVVIAFL